MIKHGVVMVTLLILTLSLLGVVSASDVTASGFAVSSYHESAQTRVTHYESISAGSAQYSHSGNAEYSHSADVESVSDDVEEKIPIYSKKNVVEIEDGALDTGISYAGSGAGLSDSCVDAGILDVGADYNHSDLKIGKGIESEILISDIELSDNGEMNASVTADVLSVADGSCLRDDDYKFGQEITAFANELSHFEYADEILVIAQVGENEFDNVTVENVLNGINDASDGYITYRKGNLIKLSSIESGLVNIAFFIKKGEFLTMVFYRTGDMTPIYSNNVGPQDSAGLWMKLEELLWSDGASSNAKSLSNRLSEDVLSFGENGYHNFAALTLESIIQTLLEYNLNDDTDLPLDDAGRYLIGVSGDSDDNAFIWYAPDKSAYLGVDSNDNNMIGFNLEDNTSQSRMITVMSYDQTNTKEMVENNLNPDESVVKEKFDAAGEMTPADIKQIGVDAGKRALDYFESRGIDVDKYYQNFYILTSAGSVKVNGQDTYDAIDGLLEVFGQKIGKNLISIDIPLWKDLVFYFLWVSGPNSDNIISYALKYVSESGKLIESCAVKRQGDIIAYEMGLYGHHPSPDPEPPAYYPQTVYYSYLSCGLAALVGENVANNTNMTNQTNASGLKLSDVKKLDPGKVNSTPASGKGSPYNILYNIAAIFIICVVFGASYSKR